MASLAVNGLITSGVTWHNIDPIRLVEQVLGVFIWQQ